MAEQIELDETGDDELPHGMAPKPLGAPRGAASKRLQLFSASLAEIPQRIDVFVDPIRSHLVQGDVRREIGVDDDANHRVCGLDDFRRG